MYYENIITSFSCHNIFTITEISVPYRSEKKNYIYNIFTTNFKWQSIFYG